MTWMETTNRRVAESPVGRWFQLEGSGARKERKGSKFFTEIRAGLACFFAMAYIIAVNSSIVAESGGTCKCNGPASDPFCMAQGSDDYLTEYKMCTQIVRRDAVTATAAISALGTFFMGLLSNLPVGLAPGMGLNAYFTFSVVGPNGSGGVPYEVALTAIFIEGFIFFGLAVLGLRQWLARAIPRSIKVATSVGIGLFLTLIGLTYGEGIGLIVGAKSTPIELAGCSPDKKDPTTGLCPSSEKMRNPTMWIGIFCGGIFTVMLLMYRVKGAIIAGVALVSIISWPRNTPVTYFPYTETGDSSFDFFKKVVDFHQIQKILNVQEWNISGYSGKFGLALVTFLYVDILDATGTLYAMARFADLVDPVTQDFEGSSVAYMVDAIGISIGAVLGVPPITAFVESGAGISEGGKTGLTAMVAGICFFISVFFAPIFASIPPWATGCVLVLVGSMMASSAIDINWRYIGDAVPAFLTIAIMPFTYSIADGLIAGVCSYICLNTLVWLIKVASGGRIVPPNYEERDGWTWRMPGGFFPPWTIRLMSGKKDFWRDDKPAVVETMAEGSTGKDNSSEQGGSDTGGKVPETTESKKRVD